MVVRGGVGEGVGKGCVRSASTDSDESPATTETQSGSRNSVNTGTSVVSTAPELKAPDCFHNTHG